MVQGKKGKMLVCPDRNCGFRQPEKSSPDDIFKKGKQNSRLNQKLIKQYSDNDNIGTNLGDLLKAAMKEKEKGKN